ncbi:hypothetical protein [Azospirillum sp.]|uniref:hypothetical protein n=1 Tax=Azospirillum sp. TaxID=34012 RepID=UPI002D5D08EF|nr:hypothetical protein [Azospirillum sp.]HYD70356.1 hypothetical protein [Azospirillum sp.]
MVKQADEWLRAMILSFYAEALATAAAKRIDGPVAHQLALLETASLVSGQAGRPVGEEEVARVLLDASRRRRAHRAVAPRRPRYRVARVALRSVAIVSPVEAV